MASNLRCRSGTRSAARNCFAVMFSAVSRRDLAIMARCMPSSLDKTSSMARIELIAMLQKVLRNSGSGFGLWSLEACTKLGKAGNGTRFASLTRYSTSNLHSCHTPPRRL